MKKRIIKILLFIVLAAALLTLLLNLALQFVLPLDSVKNKITGVISSSVNAPVSLADIRGNLRGFSLKGLNVGDVITVKELRVKFAFMPLLKGQILIPSIVIDGLTFRAERAADGSFNFDKMFAPAAAQPQPQDASPSAMPQILIESFRLTNSTLSYLDHAQNTDARAEKLSVKLDNFSLSEPFLLAVNAAVSAAQNEQQIISAVPLELAAKIKLDLPAGAADVQNSDLDFLSTQINVKGPVNYGASSPEFNFDVLLKSNLDGLSAVSLVKGYAPKGALSVSAKVTQNTLQADAILTDAGALLPQAGELTDVAATITAALTDIKVTDLNGKLNGHAFNGEAAYLAQKTGADVTAFLKADKLDTHYLSGSNLQFNADMKGLTPELNNTFGTLSLSAKKGQIKDLYRLTNANAVTKVLFVSLGVISTVVNTLDVLSVLQAIGSAAAGVVTHNPEDNAQQTSEKLSGVMSYDAFNTSLDFNKGVSKIKNMNFAADKFSFKVKGDIDFNNRKIDMTVNAAPGNVTEGIMPLAVKINGTVEEPKGSLSMLSSTAALVSQTILNNPASNLVKSSLGGLGGLLGIGKKKEDGEQPAPDEYIPLEPAQSAQ